MGLDMYLNKRTYVGNQHKEEKEQATVIAPSVKQERVTEIIESIGYWRKANAIHNWFIENIDKEYHLSCN